MRLRNEFWSRTGEGEDPFAVWVVQFGNDWIGSKVAGRGGSDWRGGAAWGRESVR